MIDLESVQGEDSLSLKELKRNSEKFSEPLRIHFEQMKVPIFDDEQLEDENKNGR
jgi:hypothetical protein